MKLLLRWESLSVGQQILIALPTLVALLFLLHLGPLDQPLGRAVFYALFWGLPATGVVIAATRNEARKRAGGERPDPNP